MVDLNGFDANTVEPMGEGSYVVLPKGNYTAICVGTGWKPTKAGDGEYLQFDWEIVEGEHRGASQTSRLNLKNKNATAVKIAQSELSSICRATGVMRPRDSDEFRNKPITLKVDVEERKDKPGSYSNRIKGYASPSAAPVPAPTPAPTPTPTQPAASNPALPPWRR